MTDGFLRVASVSPRVKVGDVATNVDRIIAEMQRLEALGVEVAVFPEMCITGYTCADLFHNRTLLDAARSGLDKIAGVADGMSLDVIVGLPMLRGGAVRNCAALLGQGAPQIVEKTYLPQYNEFYEGRWFAPSQNAVDAPALLSTHGVCIGIEICEDLWVPVPPSCHQALAGAKVIFNLSASDDVAGKYAYTRQLISQQSARLLCGYVYSSAGFGESSTDLVFSHKNIIAECGRIMSESDHMDSHAEYHEAIADIDIMAIERDRMHMTTFHDCAVREGNATELPEDSCQGRITDTPPAYRSVDPHPFVPHDDNAIDERCTEIVFIQESGLAQRLSAIGCRTLTVGISGGLDSTLALLVAVRTFDRLGLDRKGIIGVTMPGFGTTDRTYHNAMELMQLLGITIREVPIAEAVMQHFSDIGHDPAVHDVTYENSQARYRTMLLMDIANQTGGIVLGTGDLSELALGWATYNGDHMSMYGVNAGVPKTLVKYLVRWFAMRASSERERTVLLDIIDTPISPELTPADSEGNIKQKTEELVGPYELADFFLYYMLRYGFSPRRVYLLARKAFSRVYNDDVILRWMRKFYQRFFTQQFKRSCLPDGPKVGSVCLSPRGDWRMPSDASVAIWLKEIDSL